MNGVDSDVFTDPGGRPVLLLRDDQRRHHEGEPEDTVAEQLRAAQTQV